MSVELEKSQEGAAERSWRRVIRIAGTPPLRDYIAARLLEMTSKWMFRFTNAWVVWKLTHSPAMVGVALLCLLAPGLLVEPLGGILADRFDRRRVMSLSCLGTGTCNIVIALLALSGGLHIELLFALLVIYGAISSISQASSKTIVTAFVPRCELPTAVALNAVIFNVAGFIGPSLAGILIATIGSSATYFTCTALTFTFALLLLRIPPVPREGHAPTGQGVLEALRAGLAYVISVRLLWLLFVLHVASATLARPFLEFVPGLVDQMFHTGATGVSVVMSAVGVGSVAGGLWLAGRDHRYGGLLPVALGAMPTLALAMIAFAWSFAFWLSVMLAFVAGFGMITRNGAMQSMLQLEADPSFRGRVVALYGVTMDIGAMSGAFFSGLLAELVGLSWALSCSVALALAVWYWVREPLKQAMAAHTPAEPA